MPTIDYLKYDAHLKRTEIIGESILFYKGKPSEVLERWANQYGLGISGSISAFKTRLSIKQKIPVLIDPFHQVYFFPTLSPQALDCHWINVTQVKNIKAFGLSSIIKFKDEQSLTIPIGRRSLIKQIKRCQAMEHLVLQSHLTESLMSSMLALKLDEINV